MKTIDGKITVDGRGKVSFVNNFDFKDVKRFYMVENHFVGVPRGWHGHKKEAKYVFVPQGSAQLMIKDMKTGDREDVYLSSVNPQILYIPPGKYNASNSLEENTMIIYYSTSTLEESLADDFREDF